MSRRLQSRRAKISASKPLSFETLEARRLMAFDLSVIDANTQSNVLQTRSTPIALGTTAIFFAADQQNGLALWKSDGTSTGTVMIKDANLDSEPFGNLAMAKVGSLVYFAAAANASEIGLWKTDGTVAGTTLVKNLGGSSPDYMKAAGNTLYFRSGGNLWQSNGTDAGTSVVSTESPSIMLNIGSTLYFKVERPTGEAILKRSGNTTTTILSSALPYSNIANLTDVGGTLYFSAFRSFATQLMQYNGTTVQSMGVLANSANANVYIENVSGTLFVNAVDSLRKLNTLGQLETVRSGLSVVHNLTNVSGKLFFEASTPTTGKELWKSDGTEAGTTIVRDITLGEASSNLDHLINVSGTLYFTNSAQGTVSLWKSNGTAIGTRRIKDLDSWDEPSRFANIGGALFFAVDEDYVEDILWRSDGTESGTAPVKQIQTFSSNASALTPVGDKLFFTALENNFETELWVTDGTQDGLVNLNINPSGGSEPSYLVNVNGTLYFAATTDTSGTELWKSDGTPEGTSIVSDLRRGSASSFPRQLTNVDGLLYFTIESTSSGRELWLLGRDGPVLVRDIRPGINSSNIANMVNIGSRLYFTATNGVSGIELWTSTGSAASTVMVRDIAPGATNSNPQSLTAVGTTLYFQANDGVNGAELWKSTGTSASTVMVRNIVAGANGSNPSNLTNVNGTLFFSANDGFSGTELFRSNGTSLNTSRVADIFAGRGSSNPSELTNVLGTLYFSATDASGDRELWRATTSTASLVSDISFVGSSNPNQLENVNGMLYFGASDGAHGNELWQFDGTSSRPVVDHVFGTGNGNPAWIVPFGQSVAFASTSTLFGREAFIYDPLKGSTDNDFFRVVPGQVNGNDVLNVFKGASETINQLVGRYAPSSLLRLNGGDGIDHIVVHGADISVDQAGIRLADGSLVTENFETRQLSSTSDASVFRFDADAPLGALVVSSPIPSNAPVLDFSLSTLPITIDLQNSGLQIVNENLSLSLIQASSIKKVFGGVGDDSIFGNDLANELSGGSGHDLLVGRGGDDLLSGGAGDDQLQGLAGNDTLIGSTGNDLYVFDESGSVDADSVIESAGEGIDRIDFQSATTSVVFSLALTTAQPAQTNRTIQLSAGDVIENLTGGQANDTLLGNALDNTLNGKQGDDNLRGATGNDVYSFDDSTSAAELDTITELAAAGLDTLDFSAVTSGVTLDLGLTTIQNVHATRSIKLSSATTFENAAGGSSDDTLMGNGLANVLIGHSGNDTLKGFGKRDLLIGGTGLDELFGGSDEDVMIPSSTVHDLVLQNLNELCLEWSGPASYAQRIVALKNGVGASGAALAPSTDVLDDSGALDQLSGETHFDWFFKDAADAILDLNGEVVEEL